MGGADSLRDASGLLHAVGAPPRRIVSLVPSATETLLALGAGDLLVGRTDYDTLAALAGLPSVGGGLGPSLETLLALEPDLVIRFHGETDLETPRRLADLGIEHFAVAPETIAQVRTMISDLGLLVGRPDAADSLLAVVDSGLRDVEERIAGLPVVRAAFVLGGTPPWAAGAGSFVGELLELAGGENAFSDLRRPWAGVSPEALLARGLDVVIMLDGADLDPRLEERLVVRHVDPVVRLPGPRLHDSALEIARALHPEAFR